jgi:hypothetical protein
MFKSIYAMLLAAALLCFQMQPAHATTSIPFGSYQGAWNRTTTYSPGAVVTYNGASYFSLIANMNTIPSTHPTRWVALPSLPAANIAFTVTAVSNLGAYPGTLIIEAPVSITGTYFYNATALVSVDLDDTGVYCYVSYGTLGASSDGLYGGLSNPFDNTIVGQAAITDFWSITSGDYAQLYCYSTANDSNSEVLSAGMTVTLVVDPPKTMDSDAATSSVNNKPEVRPTMPVVVKHK